MLYIIIQYTMCWAVDLDFGYIILIIIYLFYQSDYLLDLLILPCSVLFQVNGSSRITVSISTNSSSELSTVSRDHIILSVVIQE